MATTSDPHTPDGDYRSRPNRMSTPPQPDMAAAATQLDFYQAMADFKYMFPNMDEEVIEAVLRSNQGAVDATIDQLLTMNTDLGAPATVPQRKERAEKRSKESRACDSGPAMMPPPYSSKSAEPPPSYRECADPAEQSTQTRLNNALRSRRAEDFLLDAPVPSAEKVNSGHSNGGLAMEFFGAIGGDASVMAETTPKQRLPEGDLAVEDPTPKMDPPPAPMPQLPDKMPLFNHDYTPRHQLTPKRLYKNWNPPLLGRLPDDFLRITITPSQSECHHHCHHHSHVHSSPTSLSSQHASTLPVLRSKGRSPHSRSSSQASSPRLGSMDPKSPRVSPRGTRSEELSSELIQQKMAENERKRSSFSGEHDPATLQMLEDERLALMIQNEEFLDELMGDEEFMSALERDHMNATAFEPSLADRHDHGDDPGEVGEPELDPDRPNADFIEGYGDDRDMTLGAFPFERSVPRDENSQEFRRKLNNMGGTTKKKMVTAAKRFFSRKKRPSKQLYPYPGYDLPIQQEGYEALNNERDYSAAAMPANALSHSSTDKPHLQFHNNHAS